MATDASLRTGYNKSQTDTLLAAKVSTADIGDVETAAGAALNATFATRKPIFSWLSPRSTTVPTISTAPTVSWESSAPHANSDDLDTDLVRLRSGVYVETDWYGTAAYENQRNLPATAPQESVFEFEVTGSEVAVKLAVTSSSGTARIYVDGSLAYSGGPGASSVASWLDITFAAAASRLVRVETYNALFAGINWPATTEVRAPVTRKPRAMLYGDSWTSGSGGLDHWELIHFYLQQALDWEIGRMGHGGSGYVEDASGTSAPMTDSTRLANLAAQDLDYIIIQGSVNDDAEDSSAVGTAAASVYSTLATTNPGAKLIVIGPQPGSTFTPSAGKLANRDAIAAACAAAPNVLVFLDPLEGEWITDAGLFQGDGAHLTAAGHVAWAERIALELTRY